MDDRQPRDAHRRMQPVHRRNNTILARAFLGLSLIVPLTSEANAEAAKHLDVLELFTSQGCTACPPADALLGKLSKTKDVLVLTMPVNYWDHLGWRDTLAKEAFTKRQYAYAHQRGDRQIYTPQLVVNGVAHVIGSQQEQIEAARKTTARALASSVVPLEIAARDGKLHIDTGAAQVDGKHRSGKIWVAFFSSSVTVEIGRGENNGRNVTYTNVVRTLAPAGRWNGASESLAIDIPQESLSDGVAVLLQADDSGAVLGAAAIALARR
jgi:hypothetical protein